MMLTTGTGKKPKPEMKRASNSEPVTSEGIVKFEYASLLWLPVFCPNQPVVRVSCPALLNRYRKIRNWPSYKFKPYSYWGKLSNIKFLFFNLGFVKLGEPDKALENYLPVQGDENEQHPLLVVKDTEIGMIHDMALYRQSRVSLDPEQKIAKGKAFFNVEALPEGSILSFPIALRKTFQSKSVNPEQFLQTADLTTEKRNVLWRLRVGRLWAY